MRILDSVHQPGLRDAVRRARVLSACKRCKPIEQLSGVRSLDKAMTVQSEFVKRAYETSVAESQKICELHNRLAKQTLDPFKGLTSKAPAKHSKS